MKIEIKGLDILRAEVPDLIQNIIPKIEKDAINDLAVALKKELGAELMRMFDRPTSWTLRGIDIKYATIADRSAHIWFKDEASRGTPVAKYLWPEVEGGPRNLKRFEKSLRRIGALPDGYYIVPGEKCKLDAHGNIDHGLIIQILSYFRAFPEEGYRANITEKRKARLARGSKRTGVRGFRYFVGRPGSDGIPRRGKDFKPASNLPLGIWRTMEFGFGSGRVEPIMIFVKGAPDYQPRFRFYTWAQHYVDTEYAGIFRRRLDQELTKKAGR